MADLTATESKSLLYLQLYNLPSTLKSVHHHLHEIVSLRYPGSILVDFFNHERASYYEHSLKVRKFRFSYYITAVSEGRNRMSCDEMSNLHLNKSDVFFNAMFFLIRSD